METIWNILGVLSFGLGVISLRIAIRAMRSDPNDWEENYRRVGGFVKAMRGDVPTKQSEGRRYPVQAGLAADTKNNTLKEQGALSDEAIENVLN